VLRVGFVTGSDREHDVDGVCPPSASPISWRALCSTPEGRETDLHQPSGPGPGFAAEGHRSGVHQPARLETRPFPSEDVLPNSPKGCLPSSCGDGYVNGAATEQCDTGDGIDSSTCNGNQAGTVSCHTPVCGDKYVNAAAQEVCDVGTKDGATLDGTFCNGGGSPEAVRCQLSTCGDNYVNKPSGETCDADNGADSFKCNGSTAGAFACHNTRCGDGYINTAAGEECEVDGDCKSGKACNTSCHCI